MNPALPLCEWYLKAGRSLPWRDTRNPYLIWISEVILQQTRVAQGLNYFKRFTDRFPDLVSLAQADQQEVLKYWEGLGYYSRARNLHFTAIYIQNELGGCFPDHYTELIKLKGIGPYTARAIGSLAFGNKTGVLDGNVFRVLSRYLNDPSPIDIPATRHKFQSQLDQWIQIADPAVFNQAIMELGALICTPRNPDCDSCPLQIHCKAYTARTFFQLPVKSKKNRRSTRYFNYYLAENEKGEFPVRRRPQTGFWAGLWEIPGEELKHSDWVARQGEKESGFLGVLKHVFTHFDLEISVFSKLPASFEQTGELKFISPVKIHNFAFPKAVSKIFDAFLIEND